MRKINKLFSAFRDLSLKWRVVFIIALVACAWALISDEQSVEYKTERASVGSVISTITSVGNLKHFEEAEIHSTIPGIVTEVLKQESDPVEEGDVLVRLDAAVLKARYEKARAEFETKEADFNYQSELYEKQLTSANDYNLAKIAVEHAKAEFSEAAKKLKATEIKSPLKGTVIYRSVEEGRSVDAKGGMLMKVAGIPDKMKLLVRVGEADIGSISENQRVHFTVLAFKNRGFAGEIISVPEAPVEGPGAVTYEVSALVNNPEHMLKSGMIADVVVKTAQVDDVIRIPTAALRFLPSDGSAHAASGSAVWVKTAEGLKRVPVTVGESNELYAEVKTGGLSEGDEVVVGVVSDGQIGGDSSGMTLPQPKRF